MPALRSKLNRLMCHKSLHCIFVPPRFMAAGGFECWTGGDEGENVLELQVKMARQRFGRTEVGSFSRLRWGSGECADMHKGRRLRFASLRVFS